MSYEEITFKDPNPLKRWLQRRRLTTAIKLSKQTLQFPDLICDFGAGNGELCKLLADHYPDSRLICYEPTPNLLSEARRNLKDVPNVVFFQSITDVTSGSLDAVFCLEVFEHLPPLETAEALKTISFLLKTKGILIIGVPVEIGIPALYKGIFRMSRRYGSFDATFKNVALSFLYHPPQVRPISEISPGFCFHHEHLGFDFRILFKTIYKSFKLNAVSSSPFSWCGHWFMPEVYFVAEKCNNM